MRGGPARPTLKTMDLGFRMHAERTPNPNSIKWVLGSPIVEGIGGAYFEQAPAEDVSPLAARLFSVDGVVGVFFASNFATVTKRDDIDWNEIAQPIVDAIRGCLEAGGPALGPAYVPPERVDEDGVVGRIREILEREIRPAVAMDGGDIVFGSYRDGVVELYMQGSCQGCPSSTATLKMGIEARLRDEIPEIVEVVAIQ